MARRVKRLATSSKAFATVMTGRPRVLVEPNAHHLLNFGDAAMLVMAVERFAGLWPTGSICVITESPERLARLCPLAVPVDAAGRSLWFQGRPLTHTVHRLLPKPLAPSRPVRGVVASYLSGRRRITLALARSPARSRDSTAPGVPRSGAGSRRGRLDRSRTAD